MAGVNLRLSTASCAVLFGVISAVGAAPPATPKTPTALSVEEKLGRLEQILQSQPETLEEAKALVRQIVDVAEDVLKDPRATDEDRDAAHRYFLGNLAYGALEGIPGFDDRLRAEAARLAKERPEDEAAAFAAYQVIRLDHRGPDGRFKPTAIDAVLSHIETFPKHPRYGPTMLVEIAESADEQDDAEVAVKALRILKQKFPEAPEASFAEGMATRVEAVGKPFPIAGTLLNGAPLDPESLKGKVVLVDFWATWCGPCVAEIPRLKRLYKELHPKGFEIVGVSQDDDKGVLDAFVDENEIPWIQTFEPLERGQDHPLASKYGVVQIPTLFLIDREGRLVATKLRGKALEAKVRELVAKPKGVEVFED